MRSISKIIRWLFRWLFLFLSSTHVVTVVNHLLQGLLRNVTIDIRSGASSSAPANETTPLSADQKERLLRELVDQNEQLAGALRRLYKRQLWLMLFFMLTGLVALISIYQQYDHKRSHRHTEAAAATQRAATVQEPDLPASAPNRK